MKHENPPRPIPVMAILEHEGRSRIVCLGCSVKLHGLGMLAVAKEFPFNAQQPGYSVLVYRITEPHTLETCRATIPEHFGPPWGEH